MKCKHRYQQIVFVSGRKKGFSKCIDCKKKVRKLTQHEISVHCGSSAMKIEWDESTSMLKSLRVGES